MSRQPPGRRADYRWFHAITTRWMDNDVFRHVNNVNYFSFFDTAVTYYELTSGAVDLLDGPVHCVVAEVMCRYHSSVAFPDRIAVGIRVARIGASSVRYEIGVFRNDDDVAAAEGYSCTCSSNVRRSGRRRCRRRRGLCCGLSPWTPDRRATTLSRSYLHERLPTRDERHDRRACKSLQQGLARCVA